MDGLILIAGCQSPHEPDPMILTRSSLTGLLSFMLSDEMTTGSVNSSDTHKRTLASKSHSFNVSQARFREAFPDVSRCSLGTNDIPSLIVLIG